MADVFDPLKRSEVMARIRGRGNKSTELALTKGFRSAGITGWRRHVELSLKPLVAGTDAANKRRVKVRPDFVFRAFRLAIFVDGCFWHCCPLHSKVPANNHEFWAEKLHRNVERDRQAVLLLKHSGWQCLRIWEHELYDLQPVLRKIQRRMTSA